MFKNKQITNCCKYETNNFQNLRVTEGNRLHRLHDLKIMNFIFYNNGLYVTLKSYIWVTFGLHVTAVCNRPKVTEMSE